VARRVWSPEKARFSQKDGTLYLDAAPSIWKDAKPGVYSLRFTIAPKTEDEKFSEFSVTHAVKMTTQIESAEVETYASESAKTSEKDKPFKATYPGTLS